MTILQIVGALMIMALFATLFIVIAVAERSWKIPAAIFGVAFTVSGFVVLASALLTGAIS